MRIRGAWASQGDGRSPLDEYVYAAQLQYDLVQASISMARRQLPYAELKLLNWDGTHGSLDGSHKNTFTDFFLSSHRS